MELSSETKYFLSYKRKQLPDGNYQCARYKTCDSNCQVYTLVDDIRDNPVFIYIIKLITTRFVPTFIDKDNFEKRKIEKGN